MRRRTHLIVAAVVVLAGCGSSRPVLPPPSTASTVEPPADRGTTTTTATLPATTTTTTVMGVCWPSEGLECLPDLPLYLPAAPAGWRFHVESPLLTRYIGVWVEPAEGAVAVKNALGRRISLSVGSAGATSVSLDERLEAPARRVRLPDGRDASTALVSPGGVGSRRGIAFEDPSGDELVLYAYLDETELVRLASTVQRQPQSIRSHCRDHRCEPHA